MADGRHIENVFGHNSAADCSISVKFCVGKLYFLQNLGTGTDRPTLIPQNVFFVWASASESFHIVSDTLVIFILMGCTPCSKKTKPLDV